MEIPDSETMVPRRGAAMTALGGMVLEAAGAVQLAEGQVARGILMVAAAGAAVAGLYRDLRREGLEPAGPVLYVPEDWPE